MSPTRGQQGNALQSILPMGFVLDGKAGEVLIESQGKAHTIRFTVDPVRQTPVVSRVVTPSAVKNGTRVTVRWPDSPRSTIAAAKRGFLSLLAGSAWLNPHLALDARWLSQHYVDEPTDSGWTKWLPSQPTSPHWYDTPRLNRLMAAEIAFAIDRKTASPSVRDFIGLFRGLKGTAKQNAICAEIGVAERETLKDFFQRAHAALKLLVVMRRWSRPVKPKDLGVIGEDHLKRRLSRDGCDWESIVYRKAEIEDDGLPYVIEVAFGYREEDENPLRVAEGFNFAPAIGGSPFRLSERLAAAEVDSGDPVTVFAHVACPRLDFLDRGKARVNLPSNVADKLNEMIASVTAKWTKQKRAEIRHADAAERRSERMTKPDKPMSIKEAAWKAMPAAYAKAAGGVGKANPRQIMYAARGSIQQKVGKPLGKNFSKYFTQGLLPDYMDAHPRETVDWDIIWDNRGHFREPHTRHEIGLGTEAVRDYISAHHEPRIGTVEIAAPHVWTHGPEGRFAGVVYIEKEGFDPILEQARIAEEFDLALMSCKGMSVTAGRALVEELCGKRGLPLYILHDFDLAGFSIKQTLFTSGRRYKFRHPIKTVIDLGLRLDDIDWFAAQGTPLASETVTIEGSKAAAANRLRINQATPAEIEFLLRGAGKLGQRVELNAMTSDQFVAFVERKLREHRAAKVVPEAETLGRSYVGLKRGAMAQAEVAATLARINAVPVDVPADLRERVRAYLVEHPKATWDGALRAVVGA